MSLLVSREVRWFGIRTAQNKNTLDAWIENFDPYDPDKHFLKEGIWDPPDERVDLYAVVPNAIDMGIKWREGQLQIKGRQEDCGVQCFGGGSQGRVEQWLKWTYKGCEISSAFLPWFEQGRGSGPENGPLIVAVAKARALRRIKVDGQGMISEISSRKGFSDRGVNVELTWLNVLGDEYWSIGFESFPDDSAISTAFTEVADRFLVNLRGVDLRMENCDSYPSWLAKLAFKRLTERPGTQS